MKCGSEHPYDPDANFCCRVQYWKKNGSPLSLPTHFKAANEGHYTQREIGNEIISEAKRTGREIQRAR